MEGHTSDMSKMDKTWPIGTFPMTSFQLAGNPDVTIKLSPGVISNRSFSQGQTLHKYTHDKLRKNLHRMLSAGLACLI